MELEKLIRIYSDFGCTRLYAKVLPKNANSKNQVYVGGSMEAVNILPVKDIAVSKVNTEGSTSAKPKKESQTLWATIDFSWVTTDGKAHLAPNTKLIVYPQYPEVRMSGFLAGCEDAPQELIGPTTVQSGRVLFLGVNYQNKKIYGYVAAPESSIIVALNSHPDVKKGKLFLELSVTRHMSRKDEKSILLEELARIHQLNYIKSKRLSSSGEITTCNAQNCGGYTLESELGIIPNGRDEPDYLGYEIKSFTVKSFDKIGSARVTLMTPEPDRGFYADKGMTDFVHKYGYPDMKGIPDRLNFGGIHKFGITTKITQLKTELLGYDIEKSKISDVSSGMIALVDGKGNLAAGWSFVKLIEHWAKKHNKAAYVPNMKGVIDEQLAYKYSNKVILGHSTEFNLFLKQMIQGKIYLDPALKIENVSSSPKVKARNQFRMSSDGIPNLYNESEIIDLRKIY